MSHCEFNPIKINLKEISYFILSYLDRVMPQIVKKKKNTVLFSSIIFDLCYPTYYFHIDFI